MQHNDERLLMHTNAYFVCKDENTCSCELLLRQQARKLISAITQAAAISRIYDPNETILQVEVKHKSTLTDKGVDIHGQRYCKRSNGLAVNITHCCFEVVLE